MRPIASLVAAVSTALLSATMVLLAVQQKSKLIAQEDVNRYWVTTNPVQSKV